MLNSTHAPRTLIPRWKKLVSAIFAASLIGTALPVTSASARSTEAETPAEGTTDPVTKAGAQVIGALVPVLPMEADGFGFARIFALNLGSAPTAAGSTTSVMVSGLPSGVEIDSVSPEPTSSSPGWSCEVSRCDWVDQAGAGAQIPVGETIEGIVRLRIPAGTQIATIKDEQVREMVEASSSESDKAEENQKRMQEIASTLTPLKVGIGFQGDSSATSQETESYLGLAANQGVARIATVMSGRSTATVGEETTWDVTPVNIGGATSSKSIVVKNLLPSGIGLQDVTAKGSGWTCEGAPKALTQCTYSDALKPGEMGNPLRITAIVADDAKVDKTNKWQFEVEGMPSFVPADGTFTASAPALPDLGLQLLIPNQVVVPGRDVTLNLQIATYAGSTRKPVTLKISGLAGATVKKIAAVQTSKEILEAARPKEPLQQVDYNKDVVEGDANADTNDEEQEDVFSKCVSEGDAIVCQVNRIRQGQLRSASLTLELPEDFTAKDNSAVVTAEISTEDEPSEALVNNKSVVPVVVQPANRPFPSLLPAQKNDKGEWIAFGGESLRLKSGQKSEVGFVVRNTGAKPFAKGDVLGFTLYTQQGVTVTPASGWKCTTHTLGAPKFTEEQRLGAATAARSAGIGFDLNRPASKLEEELIDQIKEQATVSPIPNDSGDVPALKCEVALAKSIEPDEVSEPATFSVTVNDDADVAVKLWRAELTEPATEKAPQVDFSVLTTVVKKAVSPVVVADPVRSGSRSSVKLSIANKGETAAKFPAVVMSIPGGLSLLPSSELPKGWVCLSLAPGLTGGITACTSSEVAKGAQSTVATFQVQADASRKSESAISSVALTDTARIGLSSIAKTTVPMKDPLLVKVVGPETVNDVSIPVDGGEPAPTRVYMSAQSSTDGLRYTWKQLCTTKGEANCFSIAPKVKWVKSTGQSGEFLTPQVTEPVDLTIQVTGSDGNAASSSVYIVRLLPRPKAKAPPAAGSSFRLDAGDGSLTPSRDETLCVQTSGTSVFRFAGVSCSVLGIGSSVTLAFVSTTAQLVNQLKENSGNAWIVSSNASWLTPTVVTGNNPRLRLSASQTGLASSVRNATVTLTLNPATGSNQVLGTFTVRQYPVVAQQSATTVPRIVTSTSAVLNSTTTTSPAAATTTTISSATTTTTTSTSVVAATTTVAPDEDVEPSENASRKSVEPAAPASQLLPVLTTGNGSQVPRLYVVRQLGDLAVRANVLGARTTVASLGSRIVALASASGASNYTWTWRIVSGPSGIADNETFRTTVEGLTGPRFSVTLPESLNAPSTTEPSAESTTTLPEEGSTTTTVDEEVVTTTTEAQGSDEQTPPVVTASGLLVVAVTVTANGRTATDYLTIEIPGSSDSDASDTASDALSLDGLGAGRPIVLAPEAQATIGAATVEGFSIRWTSTSDDLTLTAKSSTGVTVSATTGGTYMLLAEALDADERVVKAMVVPIVVATPSAFTNFCDDLESTVSDAIEAVSDLDLSAEFSAASDCTFNNEITFTDKTLSIGVLRLSGVSGTVTREGIAITSGTGEASTQQSFGDVTVKSLFIPFKTSNSALGISGHLTGTGIPAITSVFSEEKWQFATSLRVVNGDLAYLSVSGSERVVSQSEEENSSTTTVAGVSTDEDSSGMSFTAIGAFGDDQSVNLAVNVKNFVIFDGLTLNADGDILISQNGEADFELSAELAEPVAIATGVELSEAELEISNDSISGSGTVKVDRDGLELELEAKIEIEDDQQTIDVSTTIESVTPVEGFTLSNVRANGRFRHGAEGWAGQLSAAADDLSFASDFVNVSDPTIRFGIDCTNGQVQLGDSSTTTPDAESPSTTVAIETTEEGGCDVTFGLTAGIEINTSTQIRGSLSAAIDTEKGTAEFTGTIQNVNFGSGVVLDDLELRIKYRGGKLAFTGEGQMTVLGTEVNAGIEVTDKSFIVRAGVDGLAPFGSDDLTLEAGEVVVVVAQPEDSPYSWTPKNDDVATLVGEQELKTGDIRIAAIVGMPEDFSRVQALTGNRFELPTKVTVKGEYNFGTGKTSLEIATADGTLDVSGSLVRKANSDKWGYSFNARTSDPITILNGFKLTAIEFNATNLNEDGDIDSLSVKAHAGVEISFASIATKASATIEFSSTDEWSISVAGAVTTFSAIPGLELNDLEFNGSIARDGESLKGTLELKAADISFADGLVKLVEPTLQLDVRCGEAAVATTTLPTGTTTPSEVVATTTIPSSDNEVIAGQTPEEGSVGSDCALILNASMTVEVNTNGQTYSGELTGSINTVEGTASFEASLGEIEITDDVTLRNVTLKFDVEDGEASATLKGGITLFGTTVEGRIFVSSDAAVLQVGIADLAPFGSGGPSIRAGEIALVLKAPAAGWTWDPLDNRLNALTTSTVIAESGVRFAAIVGMPSAFEKVETITRGIVALPTAINITGSYSFGNGAISLNASAPSANYDLSGSLSRANSDADWAWDVTFATTHEINLIPGFSRVALTNASFNITNQDEDGEIGAITVVASGGLRLTVSDGATINVGAEMRFAGTDDWNLTVTGAVAGADGGSWQIIPGLNLPATNVTGSVSKLNGTFTADLRIAQQSDWTPITGVRIRDLFIQVGVKNTPESGWAFNFGLGGKLKLTIGSVALPELAITGGFEDGVWYLQVEVGDETCRDVPVASTVAPTTTEVANTSTTSPNTSTTVSPTTSSTPTSIAAATSTTAPAAAGQSLFRLSPSNSPPSVDDTTTTSLDTSDPTVPSVSVPTQNVCERVIEITDGLEIIDATFRLQYDTNESELSAKVSGGLRILGFQIDAAVTLSNQGLFMVAGVKNWELFDGGPTFSEMAIIFSTYDTTYTLTSGYEATVPGLDVTLIAQMAVPAGITQTVGDVQLEPLVISLRGLLTGNIDLRFGIILPPEAWIFKAGGYGLRLASVGLQLSIRNFAEITVGIYGEARLLVPDQDNQVPFRIAISFAATGSLSITASMGLDANGNVMPWRNVFGIDGLTINFAAFSLGINFASTPIPTPEIGLALSFQLPTAIRDLVGMEEGIDIEGAFFFSTTRGVCLVVSIGQEPKVGDTARTLPKAINMLDGNLIGNYLGIKFAPIGCTIAEREYEPGISLGFSAAIMGVSFTALAKLDINDLELQIYANFDAFQIGSLSIDQTYMDVLISGTNPLDSHIIFSGGFTLEMPAGPTRVSLKVVAQLGDDPIFAIDGRIDNMVVIPGILEINRVRIQGLVKPTELSLFINLEGDVLLLGVPVQGRFRLDVDSSGVREVSASLNANMNIGGGAIALKGMFDFNYLRGGFPNLRFAGALVVANKELASAEGQLDQYSFSLRATLDLGEVFRGQVEGKVIFCNPDGGLTITNQAGNQVTGAKGDFYFAASASINLGFASANGSVKFGRSPDEDRVISENCPVMAPTVESRDADSLVGDAIEGALRCQPGYVPPTTLMAPTTSAGQTTTTLEPCPSTTTSSPNASTTTTQVSQAQATTTAPPAAAGQSLRMSVKPTVDDGSTTATCQNPTANGLTCDLMLFGSLSTTRLVSTFTNTPQNGLDGFIRATSGLVSTLPMETRTGVNSASECNQIVSSNSPGIDGNGYRFNNITTTRNCLQLTTYSTPLGGTAVCPPIGPCYMSGSSWTLEAWVKPESSTRDRVVFGSDVNGGLSVLINPNNRLMVSRRNVANAAISNKPVQNGVWNHIVVVHNFAAPQPGTQFAGTYTYYINGEFAGTVNGLYYANIAVNTARNVLIGAASPWNAPMVGSIDQPALYSRALDPTDVSNRFNLVTGLRGGTIEERDTYSSVTSPTWANGALLRDATACGAAANANVACIAITPTTFGVIGSDRSASASVTRTSVRLINNRALNAVGTFTQSIPTTFTLTATQSGQASLPPNSLSCVGSGALQNLSGFAIGQRPCSAVTAPMTAFSADLELGDSAATAVNNAFASNRTVRVELDGLTGTTSLRTQADRVFAQVNVEGDTRRNSDRGILKVIIGQTTVARIAIGRAWSAPAADIEAGNEITDRIVGRSYSTGAWCAQADGLALGAPGSVVGCRTLAVRSGTPGVALNVQSTALLQAGNNASTPGQFEIRNAPSWLTWNLAGTSHAGLPNKVAFRFTALAAGASLRSATVRLVYVSGSDVEDLGPLTITQVPSVDPVGSTPLCRYSSANQVVATPALAQGCVPYLRPTESSLVLGLSTELINQLAVAGANRDARVTVETPSWMNARLFNPGRFGIPQSLHIEVAENELTSTKSGEIVFSVENSDGEATVVSRIDVRQLRNPARSPRVGCTRVLGPGSGITVNNAQGCAAVSLNTSGNFFVAFNSATRTQMSNALAAGGSVTIDASSPWVTVQRTFENRDDIPSGVFVNVASLPDGTAVRSARLNVAIRTSASGSVGGNTTTTTISGSNQVPSTFSLSVTQQAPLTLADTTTPFTCRDQNCGSAVLSPTAGVSVLQLPASIVTSINSALAQGGSVDFVGSAGWLTPRTQFTNGDFDPYLIATVGDYERTPTSAITRKSTVSVVYRAPDAAGTSTVLGSVNFVQTLEPTAPYATNTTVCAQPIGATATNAVDAQCRSRIVPASGVVETLQLPAGVITGTYRVTSSASWLTAEIPNNDVAPFSTPTKLMMSADNLPRGYTTRSAVLTASVLQNGTWTTVGTLSVVQQPAAPAEPGTAYCETPAASTVASLIDNCEDVQFSRFSGTSVTLSLDAEARAQLRTVLTSGNPVTVTSSEGWATPEFYNWTDVNGIAVPSTVVVRFAALTSNASAVRTTNLTLNNTITGSMTVENLPRVTQGAGYFPMACGAGSGPTVSSDGDFLLGQVADSGAQGACEFNVMSQIGGTRLFNLRVPIATTTRSTADVASASSSVTRAASTCVPATSTVGGNTVLTFTNTSTCTWAPPIGVSRIDVLAVGGGGGAGFDVGGGGSGGQVVPATSVAVTPTSALSIAVGSGGSGATSSTNSRGANGGATTVTASDRTISALGGRGAFGCAFNGNTCQNKNFGAISNSSTLTGSGAGGNGFCAASKTNCWTGTENPNATLGGTGFTSSITGTAQKYGAGGNGGFCCAQNATGAGAGGTGSNTTGGNGANGVVIVRYKTVSVPAPKYFYVTSDSEWLQGRLVFGATGTTNDQLTLLVTANRLSSAARPRTGRITVRESATNSIVRSIRFRQDRIVTPIADNTTTSTAGTINTFPNTFTTNSGTAVFDAAESGTLLEVKSVANGVSPIASGDTLRVVKTNNSGQNWVSAMLWEGISGTGGTTNKMYVHVDELPTATTSRTATLRVERLRTLAPSLTGTCTPNSSQSGVFTVVTFTNTTSCTWAPPSGVTNVDMLVVGGGGGGGHDVGGGGASGQANRYSNIAMPSTSLATIQVGASGNGSPSYGTVAGSGSASTVSWSGQNFTASGGGGANGCNWNGSSCQLRNTGIAPTASVGLSGSGTGGNGYCRTSTGPNCTNGSAATDGGAGYSSDITGTASVYARGGNGGRYGSSATQPTEAGSGGNGGGGSSPGSNGRNGIVVIRYVTAESSVWQPISTFNVEQRRNESTAPYSLPVSESRKAVCTDVGGSWTVVGTRCRALTIGYRVSELDIRLDADTSMWGKLNSGYQSYMYDQGLLINGRDGWALQTSPGNWRWNNQYRGLYDVSQWNYGTNEPWDGTTRQSVVRYSGLQNYGGWWYECCYRRNWDSEVGTLTITQKGQDLPEYVAAAAPTAKGDPGVTGVDCVVGNSPIWYNDGSGDQSRGCRLLEVGADISQVGLDLNQSAINSAITDTNDGHQPWNRCTWPIETVAEVDNPGVTVTSNRIRNAGQIGVSCGASASDAGRQLVNLPEVAPNEVLVIHVTMKYRSMRAFQPQDPALTVEQYYTASEKFEEYLGDYYIIKYGANAVGAEEAAYAELLASSGGASPYELPLPASPLDPPVRASASATAASFAAYQESLGLAPRTTWGKINIDATLNLGPLQGALSMNGSFDVSGKVDLDVAGNLTVAPLLSTSVRGGYHRKADGQYKADLQFSANVANVATVDFNGTIKNGIYDFKGTGALSLGSVVQADGKFRLTNSAGNEGLVAEVNFFAGQQGLASVRGKGQVVFSANWWGAEFAGKVFTPIGSADAALKIGNLRFTNGGCSGTGYTGQSRVIAGTTFCELNSVQLNAYANVTVFRQNFALDLLINNTTFRASATAPANFNNGGLNTLGRWTVFWLPFRTVTVEVRWGGQLTIQSTNPSIAFAGRATLTVSWYGSVGCDATINGQFKPTKLGASVRCSGIPKAIGFSIG